MTTTILLSEWKADNINTIEEVKQFFKDLKKAGFIFHPDDDFTDYTKTTPLQGIKLNELMSKCWEICLTDYGPINNVVGQKDIYTVAMDCLYPSRIKLNHKGVIA